ncbi:hypothetical protein FH972_023693 [Carpinus fangiana]|uniref:ACT domain-containing protein n=1 Tax=Carpinus fangiana TaxID=176857 RepID=A0A5N6KVX4_9ROSI|nr:hypothetical protein FH972_023693 [Carpinus fangiana]
MAQDTPTAVAFLGPEASYTHQEIAPATDTLGAGERLDECAAISSAATLALHPGKLRIALTGLEDSAANVTRFVVLAHEDAVGGVGGKGAGVLGVEEEGKGRVKALLAFSLAEEGQKAPAGALAKSLAVLARHRLDMTSIAARPSGRAAWDYVFVVEVEVPQDGGRDGWGLVEEALKDVRDVAGEARCCGLWRFDESEGNDARGVKNSCHLGEPYLWRVSTGSRNGLFLILCAILSTSSAFL